MLMRRTTQTGSADLKRRISLLKDLGDDWRKNAEIVNQAVFEMQAVHESINRLSRKNNEGNLMKVGLTLIAFPFPIVVDDVLGWSFLAAGLIQKKIKNSGLYLDDIGKTFPDLLKEIHQIKQDTL